MFTINNKTENTVGPYNGQSIPAGGSLTITDPAITYLSDGTLLVDVIKQVVSITFADRETVGPNAAALLMQLGQIVNTDSDGATYARTKVVPTGMTFCLRSFEFTTATANSVNNSDSSNAHLSDVTASFFDASNNPLSDDLSTCVKTVIDFEPPVNYYIIGGQIRCADTVSSDVRVHVVAVPDVPANYGGSKVMVQNVNLRYISALEKIDADGRVGKPLTYDPVHHTNKLRFILYHSPGYALPVMISLEVFQ
jgi:hypothetical protein